MEGNVVMSAKELARVRVLEQVLLGGMSLTQAARVLDLTYRHAKRLKRRYGELGALGLVHGSRGRPVAHALPKDLAERVVALHEQRYGNFNDCHFTQMLKEHEGIVLGRETVRQILRKAGKPPKRTRRPPKHRARRPRKLRRGIMAQWDGSPHCWFGPDHPPCCLLTAIDDADSSLLAALFVEAECAVGYLRLLDMIVRRHGAPISVYQDRHSIHERPDDHWSIEEEIQGSRFPTHLGRALKELGIRAIPAYSPQAKGRIERGFATLQDRLIAELEFHGITDIDTANRWLEDVFIDRHNNRFATTPQEPGSAFRRVTTRDRYTRIGFAYEATVANDNCVRLGGLTIDIPPGDNRRSYAKAKVIVRQHLDGAWSVWYGDRKIAAHPTTDITEPIRSWKRRTAGDPKGAKRMLQVYLSSRPAPSPEGT
jgi:transposase